MTNRLRHSAAGATRAMMMSRAKIQVFIEGIKPDHYVYSKILLGMGLTSWDFSITAAENLPDYRAGTGKSCLIKWYRFLKSRRLLSHANTHRRSVSVIVLDKDIDDLTRTRCRSPHVIYTTGYEIENHLFFGGDIVDSLAATICVDHERARSILGRVEDWTVLAANLWRDWVKVCVTARLLKAKGFQGFNCYSRINLDPDESVSRRTLAAELRALAKASGLAYADFSQNYARVSRKVDALYVAGRHDKVFKGKWYVKIIANAVSSSGISDPIRGPFAERFVQHLAHGLDAQGEWASFFREPVALLLSNVEET